MTPPTTPVVHLQVVHAVHHPLLAALVILGIGVGVYVVILNELGIRRRSSR